MFHVSEAALDFALTHVIAKGDTDILPPAHEYRAVLAQWDSVRSDLAGRDLDTWHVRPARRCLSPKRGLAFRVATQLDPLDTLLITAVVYEIGQELEARRVPVDDAIVHSYRFGPTSAGQLYLPAWSFESFRERSLSEARARGGVVLMTDISDFFQRIYFHPLENALSVATASRDHARVIGKFISGWNQSVSYGIPVGPSIFRLLAEVTIDDVDRALLSEGYAYCRFSDDYRVFVADERSAREACAFLANLLLRHHGLTLQESKTEIVAAEDFIRRFERTEEDAERAALRESFDDLRRQLRKREEQELIDMADVGEETDYWDAWVGLDEYADIDYEDLDDDQKAIVDGLNLWQVLRRQLEDTGALDVPLTRFVLRRIAQLGLQDDEALLLSDIARLYPVFPQLVQALAVQHPGDARARTELGGRLLALFDDPVVGHLEYHRAWILSVFNDATWGHADEISHAYSKFSDQLTRPEAITALAAAGVAHWFRSRKQDVTNLPPWERRAFLAGARCLPRDEARHWFRSILPQLDELERVVVSWAQTNV